MQRVLGLDLGTNSIGWAVVDVPTNDSEVGNVLALGSRIFVAGAEQDGSALKTNAATRREKRSMRRQILRRSQRMRKVRTELSTVGLLPADDREFNELMNLDPAVLRERSMRGAALNLREIGRVVYWFASRRGFLSLRSGGNDFASAAELEENPKRFRRKMVDKDTGEITSLGQEGELVAFLRQQQAHHREILTERALFGDRGQLVYPVRPIARSKFSGADQSTLGEFGLHGIVFFQRKVYWHKSTIGRCSIDPGSGVRVATADRLAQQFRVQKLAMDLRVGNPERPLDPEQRATIVKLLTNQQSASFSKIRKVLRVDDDDPINFERSGRDGVKGNETDGTLRGVLGDSWDDMPEERRDELANLLLGEAGDDQIKSVLSKRFGLPDDVVNKLAKATFPTGRAAYSRSTLRRLLAVIGECETEREALEQAGYSTPEAARAAQTVDIDNLTNPLVKAALVEVRRTVRAVVKTYGLQGDKPFDVIRIELNRDVRMNAKQREETTKRQRDNEKQRKRGQENIADFAPGGQNSRDARVRYELWEGQGQCCLYCGRPISNAALYGASFEVDHILPQAQTLDNSKGNLALVCASENQAKRKRTITEWMGEAYAHEVAERIKASPMEARAKRGVIRRVLEPHVPADAIPEALAVQTGYINALTRDFVRQETGITAEVSSGRITAALRYRIGLHKDDADHRRHGLDAVTIALCDLRTARRLADSYRDDPYYIKSEEKYAGFEPWPAARANIMAAYDRAVVSHVSNGKTSGAWHEETRYGAVMSPQFKCETIVARRRMVESITTPKLLATVADGAVRQALEANLRDRSIDPAGAKLKFDPKHPPRMLDGSVIRRVRCHMSLPGNKVLRPAAEPKTSVTMGGNHSAYVYENTVNGKWRISFLTLWDAYTFRAEPLAQRRTRLSEPNETFLFSVTNGSIIQITEGSGQDALLKVTSIQPSANRIIAIPATASASDAKYLLGALPLARGNASKVVVLPDGQIRTARD